MNKFRLIFFLFLIGGLTFIISLTIRDALHPPFTQSLSMLFQEIGKPMKSIDRAISCTLPINDLDEKMLGNEIKLQLAETAVHDEKTTVYLNDLIQSFRTEKHKPFDYQVFLMDGEPNAYALPGGAICITTGLLNLLENEAELVAILGHEMGHIERGHLFDAARLKLLQRKYTGSSYVDYALEILQFVMRLTFSKSQEDEADDYSFRLLVKKQYDPFAISCSFQKMMDYDKKGLQPASLVDDFLTTHPHIELRIEKFRSRAKLWVERHPKEKWYIGAENLANRVLRERKNYSNEWQEI